MNKPRIYLAGPMSGCTWEEQNSWREYISDRLSDNFQCINPCKYYNFENPSHDSELEVMKFDLYLLKRSDLIIVNLEKHSTGTNMELIVAYENKIPVIAFDRNNNEQHPWVLNCVDKKFNDIDSLIDYISVFYSEV